MEGAIGGMFGVGEEGVLDAYVGDEIVNLLWGDGSAGGLEGLADSVILVEAHSPHGCLWA